MFEAQWCPRTQDAAIAGAGAAAPGAAEGLAHYSVIESCLARCALDHRSDVCHTSSSGSSQPLIATSGRLVCVLETQLSRHVAEVRGDDVEGIWGRHRARTSDASLIRSVDVGRS